MLRAAAMTESGPCTFSWDLNTTFYSVNSIFGKLSSFFVRNTILCLLSADLRDVVRRLRLLGIAHETEYNIAQSQATLCRLKTIVGFVFASVDHKISRAKCQS